jgi:hypothetical protein
MTVLATCHGKDRWVLLLFDDACAVPAVWGGMSDWRLADGDRGMAWAISKGLVEANLAAKMGGLVVCPVHMAGNLQLFNAVQSRGCRRPAVFSSSIIRCRTDRSASLRNRSHSGSRWSTTSVNSACSR